jgi:FkbM family methyltransferase
MANEHPGGLTREHVVWAYRLLLDRDPENEDVIGPKLAGSRDTSDLRRHLMTSGEFREKNPDYAHSNDRSIVITELDGGLRLYVDLADHAIGLQIVRGCYETAEIRFVRDLLAPGDTVVDAGANIGFFTMHMAAAVGAAGRVFAFEPLDPNADLLGRSIAENQFASRVVFQRAALGASSGTALLTFPAETLNSGGAYVLPPDGSALAGHLQRQVPVVALDDVDLRRPVRFIKMDVEGAEPQVLQGARRLMLEDRPVILTELHQTQLARASGMGADGFLDQIRAFGYRARTIDGVPIDRAPDAGVISAVLVPGP